MYFIVCISESEFFKGTDPFLIVDLKLHMELFREFLLFLFYLK
jgi:hypothetical protein